MTKLTVNQACAMIHIIHGISISRKTIYRWISSGVLPATPFGGRLYIRKEDLSKSIVCDKLRHYKK